MIVNNGRTICLKSAGLNPLSFGHNAKEGKRSSAAFSTYLPCYAHRAASLELDNLVSVNNADQLSTTKLTGNLVEINNKLDR
jgi:hypothetical protein